MMRHRTIEPVLLDVFKKYPILTLTGPRQSGKTTLCKALFPDKAYISFETLDTRRQALSDPRRFLANLGNGAILDEIQRVPELLSYIQSDVDEKKMDGRFVLTGSSQFELRSHLPQSLAGRTSLATLLPFSFEEAYPHKNIPDLDALLTTGFYPRIFDKGLDPNEAMASYTGTYLERDVRNLINIKDLSRFELFLKLCGGRTGQITNYSSIASDAGVTHRTAAEWISVLTASYIVHSLQPHFNNLNKRLIKSPKLYFTDSGLAAFLIGIDGPEQLRRHPLRGALFETFVVSELLKQRLNNLKTPNLYYWRDNTGHEIDVIMDFSDVVLPIEIKAGETVAEDFFKNLNFYRKINPSCKKAAIIYGGENSFVEKNTWVIGYRDIGILSNLNHKLDLPTF